MSVVALTTDHRQMKQSETLNDFQVLSRPVGERRTRCRYNATRDITLHPLALPEVSLQHEQDGRSVIRLRFACSPQVGDWSQINFELDQYAEYGAYFGRSSGELVLILLLEQVQVTQLDSSSFKLSGWPAAELCAARGAGKRSADAAGIEKLPASGTGIPDRERGNGCRRIWGDQAKALARYLNEQPQGWLSAHRLMKTLRWDTVHELPPDADGKTRLAPPRTESRNQLKRLYAQQNWTELLEQADRMFSEGVCHFWLDIQWYLHQALGKAGTPWDKWTAVIRQDLALLLARLPGLETLAWNDGTPFADEVTRNWIAQQVLKQEESTWLTGAPVAPAESSDVDVLALEPEALEVADSQSVDAALGWLQSRPGIITVRQRLLLRLLMARVAEQFGKNEMALLLLEELDATAQGMTLTAWEPELLFEVKTRQLKLLRLRAHRYTDKVQLARKMETLLGALVAIDPARAAVLCDTQHKD